MRPIPALLLLLALLSAVPADADDSPPRFPPLPPPPAMSLRVATFNASLYSEQAGGLVARLESGDAKARKIAAVIQQQRPDLLLLNEFDFDAGGRAADLFQRLYLEVSQEGLEPIRYDYRYLAPVNTGVPSGLDLDRNGSVGGEGRERGNDAWGYGLHPGQYGMLVLSRHPIDAAAVRQFQRLPWSALPGARRPVDPASGRPWHDDATWAQLRLSSKSHWDVPVRTPVGLLHFLVSHPTPPVFDGPENRNGDRNGDEIRLWSEYLGPGEKPWLCDDAGNCGGLPADARFVIAGDLNNDPVDGDGHHEAMLELLEHPRVLRHATPQSAGAAAAAPRREGNRGSPAQRTSAFGLRVDYVLPSAGLRVRDSGVFWPLPGERGADWLDASDHRMVWLDLEVGD